MDGWYEHSINELEELIRACPEDRWLQNLWEVRVTDRVVASTSGAADRNLERPERISFFGAFWNVAFHTVEALDAYLSPAVPYEPLVDLASRRGPDGLPDSPFDKDEVLDYLARCRVKARETFASLTDEQAAAIRGDEPFASALVRGLMHLREHTGQLGLFLGLELTG